MKLLKRWMLCRTGHFSLRELFGVILIVAIVSVIVTYRISKYVLQRQQTEFKIQFNGRVDIYRSFRVKDGSSPEGRGRNIDRQVLEGIDLEEVGPRGDGQGPKGLGRLRGRNRKISSALYRKLVELESSEIGDHGDSSQVALLCGDSEAVKHMLPLYVHALTRVGYNVATAEGLLKNNSAPLISDMSCDSAMRHQKSWSILMCLSDGESDGVCVQRAAPQQDDVLQHRVNQIEPLVEHLGTKAALCRTLSSVNQVPSLRRTQVTLPCFTLPGEWSNFLLLADARGSDSKWVLKPTHKHQEAAPDADGTAQTHPHQVPLLLVQPTKNRDVQKLREFSHQASVVQLYQENPLLLFGMPFSVTAFVLVTSLSPPRFYWHSDGIVQYRSDYQRHFKKVPGRTWSLQQLRKYLSENFGEETSSVAFSNLESVITQTLLITDHKAERDQNNHLCEHCFQLLAFEVIFNSSFHPLVVEVSPQPDLSDLGLNPDLVGSGVGGRSSLLDDMLTLVLGANSVAADVARALEEISHHVGIHDVECQTSHNLCLTSSDLEYLLAVRRETIHRAAFIPLYPATDADRYSTLIEELHRFSSQHSKRSHSSILHRLGEAQTQDSSSRHHTASLHSVLISMARFYSNMDAVEDSYDDLNLPLFQDNRGSHQEPAKLVENIFQNNTKLDQKYIRHSCSEDKSTLAYLSGFYTEPWLNITPSLKPEVYEYYATVPYEAFLIKVWAHAHSCYCEARLDDKYGLSRPSNYTLGLGANKVTILVVDVTHTEPWILSTYTLHIYRQNPGEGLNEVFNLHHPHMVCSLQQDCDLPLYLDSPCGLHRSRHASWRAYTEQARRLPACTSGASVGRWFVPCQDCRARDSCYWGDAKWQPEECTHPRIARVELKKCLTGKQILFIGDSTNRGMMHYLMEAANDSLAEWDKTHHIKVYNNINRDRTTVSFAYYPQFWLPAAQRPVFDKALYQLMKQSGPLENNARTVLVVGGVHWLATHHLNVITKALQREGLTNIKVIIKGLGAGFHQPVDGLHCLTQREHRKLVLHDAGLMDRARQLGFEVVDTFNMTMARFKDFLQGKCACHFHRVREVLPSFTQFLQSTGRHGNGTLMDMPIYYHVEGDINAEYSEILLNRICNKGR